MNDELELDYVTIKIKLKKKTPADKQKISK